MLVLSRQVDETVEFTSARDASFRIKVMINGIRGNRVNLGIEAPRSIKILRGELAGQSATSDKSLALTQDQYNLIASSLGSDVANQIAEVLL